MELKQTEQGVEIKRPLLDPSDVCYAPVHQKLGLVNQVCEYETLMIPKNSPLWEFVEEIRCDYNFLCKKDYSVEIGEEHSYVNTLLLSTDSQFTIPYLMKESEFLRIRELNLKFVENVIERAEEDEYGVVHDVEGNAFIDFFPQVLTY